MDVYPGSEAHVKAKYTFEPEAKKGHEKAIEAIEAYSKDYS